MNPEENKASALTVLDQRFPIRGAAKNLEAQGLHPLLASLFSARGVKDISEVRGTVDDLLPTSTLKNCLEMASLLADCIVARKRVLIVSDYDCDGATACAVLLAAFRSSGMDIDYLVPDRKIHGYGLTQSIVQEASDLPRKPDVIITVDAGISSNDGVDLANKLGIDVLITDHHAAPEILPSARLIVNPNQPDCQFQSKGIAGCGVAWYIAKALADELLDRDYLPGYDPAHLLQFVAMGTVADVVPLDKNNRILVAEGLKNIRAGECTEGVKAILAVSKKFRSILNCSDIAFSIAPRLNAAGRLAHMSTGIECLLSMRPDVAMGLARSLEATNVLRKEIEKQMLSEAESSMDVYLREAAKNLVPESKSTVLYGKDWHEGIVGILAGRIKEDIYQPTFVICEAENGSLKGSGRSVPGFHLKHALDQISIKHPDIMVTHGGHPMAVGVTIAPGKVEAFRSALEEICKTELSQNISHRLISHDGELPEAFLRLELATELNNEVWGQGFPEPLFIDTLSIMHGKAMGTEKQHLKLIVGKGESVFEAVAFGEGDRSKTLPSEVTVMYKPKLHLYNDVESLQMMIENFPSSDLVYAFKAEQELLKASNKAMAAVNNTLLETSVDLPAARGPRP